MAFCQQHVSWEPRQFCSGSHGLPFNISCQGTNQDGIYVAFCIMSMHFGIGSTTCYVQLNSFWCPVMPVSKSSVTTPYDVECRKLQKLCPYNSLDGVPARPRCLLVSFPDHFLNLSAYPGPVWYQIGFVGGRHSAPQHLTHEGVHVARGAFASHFLV